MSLIQPHLQPAYTPTINPRKIVTSKEKPSEEESLLSKTPMDEVIVF